MGSVLNFKNGFKKWSEHVSKNIKDFDDSLQERCLIFFDDTHTIMDIFDRYVNKLPTDLFKWISGGVVQKTSMSSKMTFIIELLDQSVYFTSCNLWIAANHSARCAFEEALILIWSNAYPVSYSNDFSSNKISTMREEIFAIPLFKNMDKAAASEKIYLKSKIDEVYKKLSKYVHAGDYHNESEGRNPHITHDLEFNIEEFNKTISNLEDTLASISILLYIAMRDLMSDADAKKIIDRFPTNIHFKKAFGIIKNYKPKI